MTVRRKPRPPATLLVLAGAGVAVFVVPLIGLLAKVPWSQLPDLLTGDVVGDALRLSLVSSLAATAISANGPKPLIAPPSATAPRDNTATTPMPLILRERPVFQRASHHAMIRPINTAGCGTRSHIQRGSPKAASSNRATKSRAALLIE